jgi:hypothetical protein
VGGAVAFDDRHAHVAEFADRLVRALTPMRAAVLYEHGPLENIVLENDYAEPRPKPGWVRLRVRACWSIRCCVNSA